MKKGGIIFTVIFICLLSLTFVTAQPPFQQNEGMGIFLETPIITYHQVNQSFDFHIHAHNSTTGLILRNDTTNCITHLYRPSDGEQILVKNMTFDNVGNLDFEIEIGAGNFTEIGQYAILFYCESPGSIGGFFEYGFDLTRTGLQLETPEAITYFIMAFGVFLLLAISFYFMLITPYSNKIDQETGAVIQLTKLKYVKLGFILLTWVLLTWFLNILIGISSNFISLPMFSGFFGFIFIVMNNLALWIGLIVMVIAVFEIIRDANLQGNIEKFGSAIK